MVGLKQAQRASDLTARIDLNDERYGKGNKKAKTPLRFRKVRGLGTQVFYVFLGVSLFFCAVRFAITGTLLPDGVQRNVHSFLTKDPLKQVFGGGTQKPAAKQTTKAKTQTKKSKKKKVRSRKRAKQKQVHNAT